VVLVVGGSLGSAALNTAVGELVRVRRERDDLAVRHLVGERYVEGMGAYAASAAHGILYQMIGYEEHMPEAYAAADLVVSRAGASTVAELAAVGLPSILVPWPGAAADHQTGNARMLSEVGAALLLPEAALSAEHLAGEIDTLAGDRPRLAAMAAAARTAGAIHHSGRLAGLIEEVAGR
jgi:UDP-N-acetylglucosamine--N-acetylmuramyl-(pentapeptide) pyrophosphoryl-undecaprenol N-acetylglucosamine transferase